MANSLPILLNGLRFCGCDEDNSLDCCQVTELGQIYSQSPDYNSNSPCQQCTQRNKSGQITSQSSSPHGEVTGWKRACARMTVLVGAYIKNGQLSYQNRLTYYSRQRDDLPNLCRKPILCPPQNNLFQCCGPAGAGISNRGKGGPYDGVSNPCSNRDSTGAPKVRHGYSFSPCKIGNGKYIAGYALASNNWWFYGESAYNNIIERIKQEDPYVTPTDAKEGEELLHTIYMHFELKTQFIQCCDFDENWGKNRRGGPCGSSRQWGLTNTQERERSVQINASLGYALSPYGLNPEECCESEKTVV
jgi:hypothetical protein